MAQPRILVVDDEAGVRTTLTGILEDEGFEVTTASDGEEALAVVKSRSPHVVLLDIWMPGRDGLEILPEIRALVPGVAVIMISGHGTVETAVKATKLGAFDFVEKPLSLEKILVTVRNAVRQGRLQEKTRLLSEQLVGDEEFVGACDAVKELRAQILRAAPSTARVLIYGENGTGKELVARMIHRHSQRSEEAFIEVNCAAIPEELIESELFGHVKGAFTGASDTKKGKFALADDGTLLLDEVADMSMKTQAKVLRVLQEQTFEPVGGTETLRADVRVLAATNKSLEDEIAAGNFREDLYFRLNVIPILVPPLRQRGDDVLLLAEHFAGLFAGQYGASPKEFTEAARSALVAYSWPGNVRELRNMMERVVILVESDRLDLPDLPAVVRGEAGNSALRIPDYPSLKAGREQFEKQFILMKIEQAGGNISRAAEMLGLDRTSLYRKIKQYGIRAAEG
jgi:two-component system nitrogen regulation response regulator NtrX